jgi:glutamine cyclotransferase
VNSGAGGRDTTAGLSDSEVEMGRHLFTAVLLLGLILFSTGCGDERTTCPGGSGEAWPDSFQRYSYRIVNRFDHALDAYTQGLVYEDGFLYEGTGLHGESSVRQVELETGEVIRRFDMATDHFGEGITIVGDSVIQVTLNSFKGFIYGIEELDSIGEFHCPYFSWGLTDSGGSLILSNGTDTLFHLSSDTFEETGITVVTSDSVDVDDLNELEYIRGRVFANVYGSYDILIIEPLTGAVTGRLNLHGIREGFGPAPGAGVLNGIAYDPGADRIFVTGKNWPDLFEIELVPLPGSR